MSAKNAGLLSVVQRANGEGVQSKSDMATYAFVPGASMDIDRLFSDQQNFLADRPKILEETVEKLIFVIKYFFVK